MIITRNKINNVFFILLLMLNFKTHGILDRLINKISPRSLNIKTNYNLSEQELLKKTLEDFTTKHPSSEFNKKIYEEINTINRNRPTINPKNSFKQTTTSKNEPDFKPINTHPNPQSSSSPSRQNNLKENKLNNKDSNEVNPVKMEGLASGIPLAAILLIEASNNYNNPSGYASSDYDYFNDYNDNNEELSSPNFVKAMGKSEKRENLIRAQRSKDLIKEIEGSDMERLTMERLYRERIQRSKEAENRTPGLLSQFVATNPYLIGGGLALGATIGLMYLTYAKMSKKIKRNQKQSPNRFSSKLN